MVKSVINLVSRGFLNKETEKTYGDATQKTSFLLITHEHEVSLLKCSSNNKKKMYEAHI